MKNNSILPDISEKEQLESLYLFLSSYYQGVTNTSTNEELADYIKKNFAGIVEEYTVHGKKSAKLQDENGNRTSYSSFLLHFSLAEKFKSYCFLNSSIALQLLIAKHRKQDNKISLEEQGAHFAEIKTLLEEESKKLVENFKKEDEYIQSKEEVLQRKLDSVRHFTNPWPIYEEQFTKLKDQLANIYAADQSMVRMIEDFNTIKEFITQIKNEIFSSKEHFLDKTEECLALLLQADDPEKYSDILTIVEDVLAQGASRESKSSVQIRYLDALVTNLPTVTLPVEFSEGILAVKTVGFSKLAQKWLDYNVIPHLIDLWDNQEATFSHVVHIFSHLKNSISHAKKTSSSGHFAGEFNSLRQLIKKQNKNLADSRLIASEMEKSLSTEFKATNAYIESEYLKVPLQTNFNRFGLHQNTYLAILLRKAHLLFRKIRSSFSKKKKEKHEHDAIEKAIEIIETRNQGDPPDHYHSLFLGKNFIGDLFIVSRPTIKEKLTEQINQWKQGLHRSLAIVGDPLSGKSTIMDQLANYFPTNEVLYLKPDESLVVEGRKIKTTKNLNEALNHISRSLRSTRPLVLVDNLHLWKDKQNPLLVNMVALMDFIASNASNIMVVVALDNSLSIHLNSTVKFMDSFTHLLDTNTASFEEIHKAIMLRHGASHKELYEKDDKPMTDVQLRKRIMWLCRSYDFNIGAVLQAWTFCAKVEDENHVKFKAVNSHFNDFLTPVEMLVLKQCLVFGSSSELQLKSQFADRFETEFRPAIRKLLNLTILGRSSTGQLIVKESVRQDLYTLLKIKDLLS